MSYLMHSDRKTAGICRVLALFKLHGVAQGVGRHLYVIYFVEPFYDKALVL